MPRVAYYLQHGNLNFFEANYWAQVVHAKNSAILLKYVFLVSGRNENFFRLVQFLAYLACLFAVYGISRRLKLEWSWALLSSLSFGLFVEVLLQAVTPQNDLLITAYVGVSIYFLLLFKEDRNINNLLFALLSMALGLGVKASFLTVLPSIFLIGLFLLFDKNLFTVKKILITIVFALLITAVFILPAGYLENYKLFKHPLGPKDVLEHSFSGKSATYILKNGSLNILRFGLDFLTLDGLPAEKPIQEVQKFLRKAPVKLIQTLDIPIASQEATVANFNYFKMPVSFEDYSYLGILGFAILWPAVLLVLFNFVKNPAGRMLALAWVVFFLIQAFSGPYDPFRGRYFMYGAVFASPLIGCFIKAFFRKKLIKMYVCIILLIGCVSAMGAVKMRHGALFASPVEYDRLTVMWDTKGVFKKYESHVPKDAVVGVAFREDSMEYHLFGEGLTRTIIPINSFTGKKSAIPSRADHLIYHKEFSQHWADGDIHLGEDYYLKKLK